MSVSAAPRLAEAPFGNNRFVEPFSCARPVPVLVGGFRVELASFGNEG